MTMYISNVLTPSAVWGFSSKVLTSLGPACLTGVNAINASITNGTIVVFSTSGTDEQLVTIAAAAQANVTFNTGLSNGVTFIAGISGGSGAALYQSGVSVPGIAFTIQNSGTVSGNYTYAAMRFH